MNTYELIVTVILVIAYTVFAVWAVTKFKELSTGIAGSTCLAAGGIGVYLSGALVAAIILEVLKAVLVLGIIVAIILGFFNS